MTKRSTRSGYMKEYRKKRRAAETVPGGGDPEIKAYFEQLCLDYAVKTESGRAEAREAARLLGQAKQEMDSRKVRDLTAARLSILRDLDATRRATRLGARSSDKEEKTLADIAASLGNALRGRALRENGRVACWLVTGEDAFAALGPSLALAVVMACVRRDAEAQGRTEAEIRAETIRALRGQGFDVPADDPLWRWAKGGSAFSTPAEALGALVGLGQGEQEPPSQ